MEMLVMTMAVMRKAVVTEPMPRRAMVTESMTRIAMMAKSMTRIAMTRAMRPGNAACQQGKQKNNRCYHHVTPHRSLLGAKSGCVPLNTALNPHLDCLKTTEFQHW